MKFSVPVVLCMGLATATAYADNATTTKSQPTAEMQKAEDVDTFFKFDSAELPASASDELQKLVDWAKCNPKHAIILEGHADPTGTQAYNLELSGKRAASVRQRLIDMGVPSQRIVITLYGELGKPQPTHAKERRVSARTAETPVEPSDLAG
jgi:outer membrane protein OmpA-like peptidoglycan-associated protein